MKKIVVVGSVNMDLAVSSKRIPKMGETIMGQKISYLPGGKGFNQAVAASRLSANVSLIGCVGTDSFSDVLVKQMSLEGLNTMGIKRDKEITGIATIFKAEGNNSIIVVPGVNNNCDEKFIEANMGLIQNAEVLVTQFEIPEEAVRCALKIAKESKVCTIVNPAPARKIDDETLEYTDFITPNETEFEFIVGQDLSDLDVLKYEMLKWQRNYKTRLIVTRGQHGVSYVEDDIVITVPSELVTTIDRTGAGDTFNGAFACCIAEKIEIYEAIKFANKAAGLSVTKFGAQAGMPTIREMEEVFKLIS